jgi:antitoxin MazE
MYRNSSFSSYSKRHGNSKDFTGFLISSQDGEELAKHGFVVGTPIRASGTISTDGAVEIVLSRANPTGTLHAYDTAGSLWFDVSLDAINLRSGNRVERLTRAHDIHITKLRVEVRDRVVHLVSTERSRFGKSKKRNASARLGATPSRMAEVRTNVVSATVSDTPRPLVSYVTKTGDNYALLMSEAVLERVGLAEGSRVEMVPFDDGRIVVTRSKRHFTLEELLAGMTPEREHRLEDDEPRGEEVL